MADQTGSGQGQAPGQQPGVPAQPQQAYQQQPYQQQAQQPYDQQPSAAEQEHNDRLGLRILLGVGKVVVAIVYVYCMAAIITITFAFFLLLFGASADASFSSWIYETAAGFMGPFQGMFEPFPLTTGGSYFATSALFAIAAYAVVAWLVHMLYEWIRHQLWKAQRGR